MILFSSIIKQFEADFLDQYQGRILPSHLKALGAMKHCRTSASPHMLLGCTECDQQIFVPHSCGHRHCPHCQHHGSSRPSMVSTAFRLLSIKASNGWNDSWKNKSLPSIF